MKQINWVNCAKFIAIFAVMVDHTNGFLYTDRSVALSSYFSVSLFIIISGMMCYKSNERHELNWFWTTIRSSKTIVIAYLLAVFVFYVKAFLSFDLRNYLEYVINFNISGPHYFVLLYLQLILVSRPLYNIVNLGVGKVNLFYNFVLGGVIMYISYLTTNYTNIFNIYGGGGKLLGGTYLFLFYIGFLISKYDILRHLTWKKYLIISIISSICWYFWWKQMCEKPFEIDKLVPFGAGFNPPSITSSVMSIIVLCMVYGIFSLLDLNKYTKYISTFVGWMGKFTLYIFLYHRFFLDYIFPQWGLQNIDDMWVKRIIYYSGMIFGSIIFEYIFRGIKILIASKKSNRNTI